MKPVMMTKFGWPHGNCFAACMASIFELNIDEVPTTAISSDPAIWFRPWQNWAMARGLLLINFPYDASYGELFKGYCILTNEVAGAPRMEDGTKLCHATVALNGVVVHDPQPNSEAIQEYQGKLVPFEITVFVALDPASYARHRGTHASL